MNSATVQKSTVGRLGFGTFVLALLILAIVTPAVAQNETSYLITPYNASDALVANNSLTGPDRSILPGDPLYPFKLSLEQLDLSFTANTTSRITKQVRYTENRLVEAETARRENRTASADEALRQYLMQINSTLKAISHVQGNGIHGHIHAILAHHLKILNQTLTRYPGRQDLADAYNRVSAAIGSYPVSEIVIEHPGIPWRNEEKYNSSPGSWTNFTVRGNWTEAELNRINISSPGGGDGSS